MIESPRRHIMRDFKEPLLPSDTLRVAVLISNKGTGSNLGAYIDAEKQKLIGNTTVAIVVSDRLGAQGLNRATVHQIPQSVRSFVRSKNASEREIQDARERYGRALAKTLNSFTIDVAMMAGWMTILPPSFFEEFKGVPLNIHPGFIPDEKDVVPTYPDGRPIPWNQGMMTDNAVEQFLDKPKAYSTVHVATDVPDLGLVLARAEADVLPDDSVESLYARLKLEEHKAGIRVLSGDRLRVLVNEKKST